MHLVLQVECEYEHRRAISKVDLQAERASSFSISSSSTGSSPRPLPPSRPRLTSSSSSSRSYPPHRLQRLLLLIPHISLLLLLPRLLLLHLLRLLLLIHLLLPPLRHPLLHPLLALPRSIPTVPTRSRRKNSRRSWCVSRVPLSPPVPRPRLPLERERRWSRWNGKNT